MTIIIDANMAVGAAIPQPYTLPITDMLGVWQRANEHLMAPFLLEYEVTSALRRAITIGALDQQAAIKTHRVILSLGIELVAPTPELDRSALYLAERIGQSKAYDAQYLALAARENAPFWTADRRLARSAQAAGLTWVLWVGGEPA